MDSISKIVPFKSSFDTAKIFAKYANYSLWISTILLVVAFYLQSLYPNYKSQIDTINIINCFFIIVFALLSILINITFYEASTKKRHDFIDNSFKTSYSEDNSHGYFSNDDIENGIYKMAVNGFENSFFSYNIAKKMLTPLWLKNIFIGFLFISLAITGYNKVFVMILQLTLPILLINQAIILTIFVTRINRINENFRRLFQDLKLDTNRDHKKPEILLNVIEYEATLSWGCILLDSKIYESLNPELSIKWEKIKNNYKI